MTNALGAVLLIFIIKQVSTAQELFSLGDAVSETKSQLERQNEIDAPEALAAANRWLEDAVHELRTGAGDGFIGVPPIRGQLVLVLDHSGSMVSPAKRNAVIALIETLVYRSAALTDVAVIRFTSEEDPSQESFGIKGLPDREKVVAAVRRGYERVQGREGTWILPALAKGIAYAANARDGGVVVLFSDGVGHGPDEKGGSAAMLAALEQRVRLRLARSADVDRAIVHTVGIFSADVVVPTGPLGQRFEKTMNRGALQLGWFLERVASSWRGSFVAVPVADGGTR